MSLEAALAANTAALDKVAGLLAEGNKVRTDLLTSAAAVATPGKRTTKPKDGAAAVETAKTAIVADIGTGSSALDAIVKEYGGKLDEAAIRKEFGGYMGVTDEAERTKRKPNVVAILAEVQAAKATEIKEEDRAKAIYWLRKFAKGETVNFKADLDDASGTKEEAPDDLL